MAHENIFKLPLSIVSLSDLKKVKRELDDINEKLLQMEIRQGGEEQVKLPKTSKRLDDMVDVNHLNLLHKQERDHLIGLLDKLVEKAPVMHMSFTSEPSDKFLDKLMAYLRESFDQYTLVTIGLAPSIGAGCIVRTTNRYFDLSLKQTLIDHKKDLIKELATRVDAKQDTPKAGVAA